MSKVEFTLQHIATTAAESTEKKEKLRNNNDKKVHWNGKYVEMLLNCVESRMSQFKNKTIHKKVWDEIGREMLVHGFSTEHCYNKWKNLRRDVRMVALHPGKGARNEQTLFRVQKLISSICPSFDPRASHHHHNNQHSNNHKKAANSPLKLSEGSSNSLEPLGKLLTPATSPFSDPGSLCGTGTVDVINGDEVALSGPPDNLFLATNAISNNNNNTVETMVTTTGEETGRQTWPYELYELLLQFRAEETKQAQNIAHITRQIHDIKDCSVRRMNTIQQLINLAHVLISSKVS